MSHDIQLLDSTTNERVNVGSHSEGGTYVLGGTTEAHLNVTYNYSFFFHHFLDEKDGIEWLYGKRAGDCTDRLEKAIEILGTKTWNDYWAPTPGNAGHALSILLKWAKQYPEAVFQGD